MVCILVGASPKAKLVLDFLNTEGRAEEVIGFVDRDPAKKGHRFAGKTILGDLTSAIDQNLHRKYSFCVCLSERRFDERVQYSRLLSSVNAAFCSIVSRHSIISSSARIEAGSIVFPGAMINAGAQLGSCVTMYTAALVDHDCQIAENVEISPRVAIAGSVSVCTAAFLGVNATILPGLKIGARAVVGAGAVVTRDVAPGDIVVGNPARVLRRAAA